MRAKPRKRPPVLASRSRSRGTYAPRMRGSCLRARGRLARLLTLALLLFGLIAGTALAATGALTQLSGNAGCVSEDGTGGDCANGKALQAPRSVAVSPE